MTRTVVRFSRDFLGMSRLLISLEIQMVCVFIVVAYAIAYPTDLVGTPLELRSASLSVADGWTKIDTYAYADANNPFRESYSY